MADKQNGHSTLNDESSENVVTEIEIPVPWGTVKGKWWGPRNEQPILAIHGWQDNAGTWDNLAPLLPPYVSLLCIDLPGHGFSSPYPAGLQYYVFWDGISLIRRIANHYNWKKVILLGHSLGGALSFMYASIFPDEVDRYISIDIASPTVRNTHKLADMAGMCIDRFLKYETLTEADMPSYDYKEMIEIVHDGYRGSVTKESCHVLMRRGMQSVFRSYDEQGYCFTRDVRLKVAYLGMLTIEQVMEQARRVRCKVMNIRAVPGMRWENPECYGLVLDEIKKYAELLDYREVEGTHHVHLNNPERIVQPIVEFLNC